jgi:hypothetical protein
MYLQERVEARRLRTSQRWDAGVGVGGGQPGSIARVWRSLDVDKHDDVEPGKWGSTTQATMRTVATGGAARFGGGVPQD